MATSLSLLPPPIPPLESEMNENRSLNVELLTTLDTVQCQYLWLEKIAKKMIKLCFWDFFEFLKSSIIQNYRNIYNPVIASIFWWSKCWATKATLLTCSNKQLRVCFPTMPKYQLPLQHSWWLIQIIINNKGEARTHHLTRFWEPWRYLSESFYLGKATRRIYRSHSTRDDFFAPLLTYLLWPFSNIDDEVSWKIAVPFLQKKKISFQASITGS